MPTRQEGVAGIVPGREGDPDSGSHRDIVVHSDSGGRLHRISDLHPAYMPLHFVLLFPHGELHWGAHLILLQRPPLSFVEPSAAAARRALHRRQRRPSNTAPLRQSCSPQRQHSQLQRRHARPAVPAPAAPGSLCR